MLQEILTRKTTNYKWIHLSAPTEEEMNSIGETYHLSPSSITDCLQPGHFPKYESFEHYEFIIFRYYLSDGGLDVDTIRSITNKVSVFYGKEFIITVTGKELPFLDIIKEKVKSSERLKNQYNLLIYLLHTCLLSFDHPGRQLSEDLDYYEEQVFIRQRPMPILKKLYYVKREVDVIRRLLILSFEIIDKLDSGRQANTYSRDLRDLYIKLQNTFDNLSENTAQLLSIYFSTSAQRTNEIMRILTIFSVFFMPLTFIVGVYGMNFHNMPELDYPYGYPIVMGVMLLITLVIYFWFKRKKWL